MYDGGAKEIRTWDLRLRIRLWSTKGSSEINKKCFNLFAVQKVMIHEVKKDQVNVNSY